MQQRATVAVVGIGGIGGVIAATLVAAGRHEVVACARRPLGRLRLERPEGDVEVALPTLTDPDAASPVDWVLLCVKAHQTPSAAPWLARLCRPATQVAVLQNGVGQVARVQPHVGPARVVPTVVYYNGETLSEGRVRLRHVTDNDLAAPDDAGGRGLAALLGGAPMRVLVSPEFATLAWRKLLINAVANPITALTLQRQSVLRRADVGALCLAVLDEAVAVARADGARLDADEARQTLATLYTYPVEAGTSMYFDRLAGRSFEVEALTGAIVAVGERLGIATPINRAFLTLLRAISDAGAVTARA